tara:strand:- start:2123 stop:2743 length:621 start_codon:yes stop_codon:yes gene_type:complete
MPSEDDWSTRGYVSGESASARGWREKQNIRDRALAAKEKKATLAEMAVGEQQLRAEENQRAIRYGTARGLSSGDWNTGAGTLAAFGQAGLDAEVQGIQKAEEDERRLQGLRSAAAEEQLGAAEYAMEAGSKDRDQAAALGDAKSRAEQEISATNTWATWGAENDAARSIAWSIYNDLIAQGELGAAEQFKRDYIDEGGSARKRLAY